MCFILKSATGTGLPMFPLSGPKLPPALPTVRCAVQATKDAAQAAAATSARTRTSSRLLCRRAESMTPLLPPRPSLSDRRSTPARCISTGDQRRSTVKEVRFKTQSEIKTHTRRFSCGLDRDRSSGAAFTF